MQKVRQILVDFFLGFYLVGFVICAVTVRRRPAEIALLWPIVILVLLIAMMIAAIDLTLEKTEHRRLSGRHQR